jgi:ribosome modulation factor
VTPYEQGVQAFKDGKSRSRCEYVVGTASYAQWMDGWMSQVVR